MAITPVPDTFTFSLQDVYTAVHGHTPATTGDLSSCETYAVSGYFDSTYGAEVGMKKFRNYHSNSFFVYHNLNYTSACSGTFSTTVYSYTSTPAVNDYIYTDEALTTPLNTYFVRFIDPAIYGNYVCQLAGPSDPGKIIAINYYDCGTGAGYYDCGYGCQYYAYDPSCTACTPGGTTTFTSSGSWLCPAGITTVVAECWSGGGAGGAGGSGTQGGGGGGGGGYIKGTHAVISGNTYYYTVGAGGTFNTGADGGSGGYTRWDWDSPYYIRANGGWGGKSYANGAAGGAPAGASWNGQDYNYYGGYGANGSSTYSGGGGGCAGSTGTGNSASGVSGGASKSENGGAGGNGTASSSTGGSGGALYGGASGGATGTGTSFGGYAGFIRITYY